MFGYVVCAAFLAAPVLAQDPEIQKLRKELESLRAAQDELAEEFDDRMLALKADAGASGQGTTNFMVTGYGFAGFTDTEGENNTFGAGFNPIFLWKLNDRLFFEAELEFELEHDETEVALEYAQLSYIVNDYMTVGVGKFLNPANYFMDRIHPPWINKLPDKPLAVGSHRIQAGTQLGVQLHGAIPWNSTKMEYAVFASNGPSLVTDDDAEAGNLKFKNFEDGNNGVTFGGRVGFFPVPELELGYSLEFGSTAPSGGSQVPSDVDALIQSVDLNYLLESDSINGTIDLRAQWVWSNVDTATFDPTGTLGFGPTRFKNDRNGGYVQVAYRPSKLLDSFWKDVEGVVRYDRLNQPSGAPTSFDQQRVTFGFNYWMSPSAVAKIAYQIDDKDGMGVDENAFFLQMAIGF